MTTKDTKKDDMVDWSKERLSIMNAGHELAQLSDSMNALFFRYKNPSLFVGLANNPAQGLNIRVRRNWASEEGFKNENGEIYADAVTGLPIPGVDPPEGVVVDEEHTGPATDWTIFRSKRGQVNFMFRGTVAEAPKVSLSA